MARLGGLLQKSPVTSYGKVPIYAELITVARAAKPT
jgi:hypothetical protein